MKRLIVCCIFWVSLAASFAQGAETVVSTGDRWLIQDSEYDVVHEVTILESTSNGKYVRVRHDYSLSSPQVTWEKIEDFRKTILEKLCDD